MGYLCDFCGEQRSVVYCESDAASLCLSCDHNVHSANALSKRHSRTLVCDRCNSQPALVRCEDERMSMCQNCDWMGHSISTAHKKQVFNCYSGCPSAAQLSEIWSLLLDSPLVKDSACEQGMGSMSISYNKSRDDQEGESSLGVEACGLLNVDVLARSSKVFIPGEKGSAEYEDGLYGDFNMDEIELGIENYEELFGVALGNEGFNGLFGAEL